MTNERLRAVGRFIAALILFGLLAASIWTTLVVFGPANF
jgi:hypothetical protein